MKSLIAAVLLSSLLFSVGCAKRQTLGNVGHEVKANAQIGKLQFERCMTDVDGQQPACEDVVRKFDNLERLGDELVRASENESGPAEQAE